MAKLCACKTYQEIDPEKSYLLLISPEEIPHLALVHEGKYYSLTYKKSYIEQSFQPYFDFLKKSGRALFFIEIDHLMGNPKQIFKQYHHLDTEITTCFVPLKECILPASASEFIFQLIPELYAQGRIQSVFQVNAHQLLDANYDFELRTYSKEAIFERISSLKKKHAHGS